MASGTWIDATTKVVAVHVNYVSRAAERGRTPQYPGYFLKPPSSLLPDGGQVSRPDGTELFTYEGEIAVVLSRTVRSVTPEQAWNAIAGYAPALDLGLRDLRAADAGSNLRSKGADGFTPIGTELLPAEADQPLRLRTWHNGELVQEDRSDHQLFDVAYLIADLSRLLTLSAGDVILTGTPMGASVAAPGDVLEVEVDTARGAPTPRLRAEVVAGPRLVGPGAPPSVTEADRYAARGVRPGNGAGPDEREVLSLAGRVSTATVAAQLRRRGYQDCSIDGVHRVSGSGRMAGRARTLRFVPHRPDLFDEAGTGHTAQKRAVDSLAAGDVLVVEARGEPHAGTLGDLLALRARHLGAAGVVSDGAVRDSAAVAETGLPVFAAGRHPALLGRRHVPWETDTVIACGGAAVRPGDLVIADEDGVVVIPWPLSGEVLADAAVQEQEEEYIAAQVRGGERLEGLYPMDADWRRRFRELPGGGSAEPVAPSAAMPGRSDGGSGE